MLYKLLITKIAKMKLNFFKKKDKKQFMGKCPVSNQNCFTPECCAGCNDLKEGEE